MAKSQSARQRRQASSSFRADAAVPHASRLATDPADVPRESTEARNSTSKGGNEATSASSVGKQPLMVGAAGEATGGAIALAAVSKLAPKVPEAAVKLAGPRRCWRQRVRPRKV